MQLLEPTSGKTESYQPITYSLNYKIIRTITIILSTISSRSSAELSGMGSADD